MKPDSIAAKAHQERKVRALQSAARRRWPSARTSGASVLASRFRAGSSGASPHQLHRHRLHRLIKRRNVLRRHAKLTAVVEENFLIA
jgi:hypothetical protein